MPAAEGGRMTKQNIPLGSITGDPIGVRRYMVIDSNDSRTAVSETVLLKQDGTEYKSPYQRIV
jgi:hypothetical protein